MLFRSRDRLRRAAAAAGAGQSLRRHQSLCGCGQAMQPLRGEEEALRRRSQPLRSEEHTSELQSLMRISYAVFCLKKTKMTSQHAIITSTNNTTTKKEVTTSIYMS